VKGFLRGSSGAVKYNFSGIQEAASAEEANSKKRLTRQNAPLLCLFSMVLQQMRESHERPASYCIQSCIQAARAGRAPSCHPAFRPDNVTCDMVMIFQPF